MVSPVLYTADYNVVRSRRREERKSWNIAALSFNRLVP